MSAKLTALTESIVFGDSDLFYGVIDPGGSPLSRRLSSLTMQRYLPMPQSSITGLTLSNNVADANNDIDIAAGRGVDGGGTYNLILPAAITKRLDAAWAVGTNQGGLDTGSEAVSTWYHVWLIGRVDTHVVDVLFSTSATAPTMPANYTKKRRIGAIKNDASGNILAFLQYGDEFIWKSPPALDVDVTNLTTSKVDYVLASVPLGLVILAKLNAHAYNASTNAHVYLSNPNLTDVAPSATATPMSNLARTITQFSYQVEVWTDIAAKISARSTAATTTFKVAVTGWVDPRGKF